MISGHEIFKLVDQAGLPLDIIVLELRDKISAFNVAEFIQSSYKAKWKKLRVRNMILYSSTERENKEFIDKLDSVIDYYYDQTKNTLGAKGSGALR